MSSERETALRVAAFRLRAHDHFACALLARAFAHVRQELEPIDVRHVDVDEHDLELAGSELTERFEARSRLLHFSKPGFFECSPDKGTNRTAVVNDERSQCHPSIMVTVTGCRKLLYAREKDRDSRSPCAHDEQAHRLLR